MKPLTVRDRPYLTFVGLAVCLFVVATFGFGVLARVTVGDEGLRHAASEHIYYAAKQPVGTLLLFLPFLLLGLLCAVTAKRKGTDRGFGVFLIGMLLLGFIYFNGYQDAQYALKHHKWTGAALAEGLLPFMSIPVLLACLVVSLILRKKP